MLSLELKIKQYNLFIRKNLDAYVKNLMSSGPLRYPKGSLGIKCTKESCQNFAGCMIEGDPNFCELTRVEKKVFHKLGFDFCRKSNKFAWCNISLLLDISLYMHDNNITYKDIKGENTPKFNMIKNYILTKLLKEM